MPIEGVGRHCNQCQHVVRDFSSMSDAELFRIMSATAHPICGRFRPSQLNRPIALPQAPTSSPWPRLLVGALLLMAATGPHFILAQAPASSLALPVQTDTPKAPEIPASQRALTASSVHLIVKVIDEDTDLQIPYVTVSIPELDMKKQAEFSGIADFELPTGDLPDSLTIMISHEDYFPTQQKITTPTTTQNVGMALTMRGQYFLGIISVPSATERMPKRLEQDIEFQPFHSKRNGRKQ